MENDSVAFFLKHSKEAVQIYPGLRLTTAAQPSLEGEITLKDNTGIGIETYQLKILPAQGYPFVFPYVFETAGKIPLNADWHVYESFGHLCLCTTTDEYIKAAGGITLVSFIRDELEPYLYNQLHRNLTGFFLHDMAHGEAGELAGLKRLMSTPLIGNIHWLLIKVMEGWHLNRTSVCFCSSGRKYRHCHRQAIDSLSRIQPARLKILLAIVEQSAEYKAHLFRLDTGMRH